MSIREELAFKERVVALFFNSSVRLSVLLFFWAVVFRENHSVGGYTSKSMYSYIFVTMTLTQMFSGILDSKLVQSVIDGSIAIKLIQPIELYFSHMFLFIGQLLFQLLTFGVFSAFFGWAVFNLRGPRNILLWVIFFTSVLIGVPLWHSIRWVFSLIVFWTGTDKGISRLLGFSVQFLSGSLIPLTFFPNSIHLLFYFFPFQSLIYTPTSIFTNSISVSKAISLTALELVWTFVFSGFGFYLWKRAVRVLTISGG